MIDHPLAVGTRVYITKEYPDMPNWGPETRTGTIVEHKPQNGGYLVKHDRPEQMGFPWGPVDTFGWCYDEVSPIQ